MEFRSTEYGVVSSREGFACVMCLEIKWSREVALLLEEDEEEEGDIIDVLLRVRGAAVWNGDWPRTGRLHAADDDTRRRRSGVRANCERQSCQTVDCSCSVLLVVLTITSDSKQIVLTGTARRMRWPEGFFPSSNKPRIWPCRCGPSLTKCRCATTVPWCGLLGKLWGRPETCIKSNCQVGGHNTNHKEYACLKLGASHTSTLYCKSTSL